MKSYVHYFHVLYDFNQRTRDFQNSKFYYNRSNHLKGSLVFMRTVSQKYLQNVHFYGFLNDAVTTWKYLAS